MQKIVVPGEKVVNTPVRIENTISDKNGTFACVIGFFDDERKILVPLEGVWQPRSGDTVIGIVEEDKGTMLIININAPYKGLALTKFLEADITTGDTIAATVKDLEKGGSVMLLKPTKLQGGKLISVSPSKIPRIIGSGNSMVKQISDGTGTKIIIGLNGVIWLSGGKMDTATSAILKIQEEAHTSGLTDRIKKMVSNTKVQ
ncbi:MAG: KH domain-containing protein [Candidatus Micrarchaeaceae archaeon]